MKNLSLILFISALLSCNKEDVEPTNTPTKSTQNIYSGEIWAAGNEGNGSIKVNSTTYNYIDYKEMLLRTGDTVELIAINVGFNSDIETSRIAIRLDGTFLFDSNKPGSQDTIVIIQ